MPWEEELGLFPQPIGSHNERGNNGIRATYDQHDYPHVDLTVPLALPGLGRTAHKIKVDVNGKIRFDDLV